MLLLLLRAGLRSLSRLAEMLPVNFGLWTLLITCYDDRGAKAQRARPPAAERRRGMHFVALLKNITFTHWLLSHPCRK